MSWAASGAATAARRGSGSQRARCVLAAEWAQSMHGVGSQPQRVLVLWDV